MKTAAVLSFLMTVLFAALCFLGFSWAMPFAITFGTCFYHFAMRLTVGFILDRAMKNKADYSREWYRLWSFEKKLYRFLRVKKWKGRMPTYAPAVFDPRLHTWDEIAQAMCQAEIVHEVIAALSFLPLTAAIPFGAFPVFLLTSLLAAVFDLSFVVVQRFNRHRILKLIEKERVV